MVTVFFYYSEQVFILMNIWMVVENLMKQHYLKNSQKDFHSHLNMKDITDADYAIVGIFIYMKNNL